MNERQAALANLGPTALAAAGAGEDAEAIAAGVVDAIVRAADARRVSIAITFDASARWRPLALSGEAIVDVRRELVTDLLAAIGEHADRDGRPILVRPDGPQADAAMRHAALATTSGHALASFASDRVPGCAVRIGVLLEREATRPFAKSEVERYRLAARDALLLAARLAAAQRTLLTHLCDGLRDLRHTWAMGRGGGRWPALWRRHVGRRATAVAAVALACSLVAVWPVPLVVHARATIEVEDRQVIAAPTAGHLVSAHARAGDRVVAGQTLARFDDREARAALASWQGEALRNDEERSRALAMHDRGALGRLVAERGRIAAELIAAERRVAQAEVLAPFDGVLLKGDPERRLGAPVDGGDALFEIGSGDRYELVLEVDESDVRLVAAGLPAEVRMAGLPTRTWQATLGELLPVAVAEPGRNLFRVPARLHGETDALRPGMQGVARIVAGQRTLLGAWTRRLQDRLTLLAWRVGLIA